MIKVYEVKLNGFLGASREIDPREGTSQYWVYDEPPVVRPGYSVRWESGQWVEAIEPDHSVPGPDPELLANLVRTQRDQLLAQADWTQLADVPLTDDLKAQFRTYRQALRDITVQEGFPLIIEWPSAPAGPATREM